MFNRLKKIDNEAREMDHASKRNSAVAMFLTAKESQ